MPEKDYGLAMPSGNRDTTGFEEVFPTETKGDGRVVENNLKTGGEQGRGSSKRKVKCKQCGFPFDVSKNDTSGGSSQGDGAGGVITSTTKTVTLENGDTFTEYYGDQAYKKGGGCPLCFSKNGAQNNVPTPRSIL